MHAAAQLEPVPLDALYQAHAAFLLRFLLKRGFDYAAAEDLVQEVFMTAQRLGGYRPGPAPPRSWLCSIAVRLAANVRRQHQRRRELFQTEELELRSPWKGPEHICELQESMKKLQLAFERLNPMYQDFLLRFIVLGETCDEIAKAEKIPVGTVYSRLHAARSAFVQGFSMAIPGEPPAGTGGHP
jgi:RNA polymerase sigma-70 factor (ECF subfamily)